MGNRQCHFSFGPFCFFFVALLASPAPMQSAESLALTLPVRALSDSQRYFFPVVGIKLPSHFVLISLNFPRQGTDSPRKQSKEVSLHFLWESSPWESFFPLLSCFLFLKFLQTKCAVQNPKPRPKPVARLIIKRRTQVTNCSIAFQAFPAHSCHKIFYRLQFFHCFLQLCNFSFVHLKDY